MRDLIVSRVGESMHDETPAQYGVITYTNTLVDANRKLLANIMSAGSRTAF
jgi:hypothetical protein